MSAPVHEPAINNSIDDLDREAAERTLQAAFAQCPTARSICLIGIDPDASGALAVMQWDVPTGPEDLQLQEAGIQVHDMPLESVPVGKRLRR